MDTAPPELLRERLLPWYRAVARDLPWRRRPTPYQVLLSELMLQQTRVETVIPYFERFVARWPTLEALAAASDEEVLGAWAGLGYYRRARSLLAAARAARDRGGLPRDPDALRRLPGVGPYTAGAIASIAHGVPAAAVDGNVERVLCRVDGVHDDPRRAAARRALTARAEAITAPGVAGEVTQALMELGATVCTPRRPRCDRCPWSDACVARAAGEAEQLPRLPARKAPRAEEGVAGLLVDEGRVLLGQRPPGLLGGLWEPVLGQGVPRTAAAIRDVFAARTGLTVEVTGALGEVRHVFTHRVLTLDVHAVRRVGGRLRGDGSYEALAWADLEAPGLPLSVLARKLLACGARSPSPVAADR
ncbi:MAG: A/G-specific adenine glycosylase [Alphaproteobacteria bacterium]|nr:A/G-specific adenine glycosylase [Alphaproteobacteria bacterium]